MLLRCYILLFDADDSSFPPAESFRLCLLCRFRASFLPSLIASANAVLLLLLATEGATKLLLARSDGAWLLDGCLTGCG